MKSPRRSSTAWFVSLSDKYPEKLDREKAGDTASSLVDAKFIEMAGLGVWMMALSSFILMNNFVGPWPVAILNVTERVWFALHMVGGVFFAGGIILTTAIEWLVAGSRDEKVLDFWFHKVPMLDLAIVLPGLTVTMVAGVGLAVEHYGSLGQAPVHIIGALRALVAFALWWALTDLTTQHPTQEAISEWSQTDDPEAPVPRIVDLRKVSNVVSCLFCFVLYGIMVFKPGYL